MIIVGERDRPASQCTSIDSEGGGAENSGEEDSRKAEQAIRSIKSQISLI